jgi:WD40 repeat protein
MMLVVKVRPAEATFPAKNGRIAYVGTDGHDRESYTIDPGGGHRVQVTHNTTKGADPSFSPSGKKIAYSGRQGKDWEIFTIHSSTTGILVHPRSRNNYTYERNKGAVIAQNECQNRKNDKGYPLGACTHPSLFAGPLSLALVALEMAAVLPYLLLVWVRALLVARESHRLCRSERPQPAHVHNSCRTYQP